MTRGILKHFGYLLGYGTLVLAALIVVNYAYRLDALPDLKVWHTVSLDSEFRASGAGKLRTLSEVGLGYVQLGQSATTLSGGEAQRVKLSAELSRRATGRTLYLLDEPTPGLHFADVHKLLEVLLRLRATGNTVVVIEHNLDVIKCADHIIDLGPDGGDGGGRVVACGTPEAVARCDGLRCPRRPSCFVPIMRGFPPCCPIPR